MRPKFLLLPYKKKLESSCETKGTCRAKRKTP